MVGHYAIPAGNAFSPAGNRLGESVRGGKANARRLLWGSTVGGS